MVNSGDLKPRSFIGELQLQPQIMGKLLVSRVTVDSGSFYLTLLQLLYCPSHFHVSIHHVPSTLPYKSAAHFGCTHTNVTPKSGGTWSFCCQLCSGSWVPIPHLLPHPTSILLLGSLWLSLTVIETQPLCTSCTAYTRKIKKPGSHIRVGTWRARSEWLGMWANEKGMTFNDFLYQITDLYIVIKQVSLSHGLS